MDSILISSYVKLPVNTTAQKVYDQLLLVAVVDRSTGIIQKVDCSMVTELAKDYVSELLVGRDLNAGAVELLKTIDQWYFGHLKKSLMSAVKMLGVHYLEFKKGTLTS